MNWLKRFSRGVRISNPHHRPRSTTRLGVERMEDRLVPVIGAAAALPDGRFPNPTVDLVNTGVVRVLAPNGWGSGTVLWTGRHVLTAAHVVDTPSVDTNGDMKPDRGDGRPDAGSYSIQFTLADGPTRIIDSIPASNVKVVTNARYSLTASPVPFAWSGDGFAGADIALIELPELAPVQANRHHLYTLTDVVGKTMMISGYGQTGNGNVGYQVGAGIRRSGWNTFDATSGDYIGHDLDNGLAANDYYGSVGLRSHTGLGPTLEAMTAPGDSGGPAFIGNQIAGVTSAGFWDRSTDLIPDVRNPDGSVKISNQGSFGEFGVHTRVSLYSGWITQQAGIASTNLVIDMSSQGGGADFKADTILLYTVGDTLHVGVNDRSTSVSLIGVTTITVKGTGDAETFLVSEPLLRSGRQLSIQGGSGSDTLIAGAPSLTWIVSAQDKGLLQIDGANLPATTFTSIENLTGGNGSDIFQMHPAGLISGAIDGGAGNNALDYSTRTFGVTVDLASGTATSILTGITRIDNAKGSQGRDTLYGNANSNVLNGQGGNDDIYGRGHLGFVQGQFLQIPQRGQFLEPGVADPRLVERQHFQAGDLADVPHAVVLNARLGQVQVRQQAFGERLHAVIVHPRVIEIQLMQGGEAAEFLERVVADSRAAEV